MFHTNTYKVGDRIRFAEEKQAYTVKARSDRYLICTKPFNARRTVLYCIVDFKRGERGPTYFGLACDRIARHLA